MSNTVAGQEFRIVLILFLLIFTVIFCHSAIRLCLANFNPRKGHRSHRRGRADTGRAVELNQPIQVVLATDEEMALGGYYDDEDKNLPPPPPAYGLWRGSVVSAGNNRQYNAANRTLCSGLTRISCAGNAQRISPFCRHQLKSLKKLQTARPAIYLTMALATRIVPCNNGWTRWMRKRGWFAHWQWDSMIRTDLPPYFLPIPGKLHGTNMKA